MTGFLDVHSRSQTDTNGAAHASSMAINREAAVLASPAALRRTFEQTSRYYLEDALLDRVWLALKLGKPLLVEGEAGCGKTELARALPRVLGTDLIRVTCGAHTQARDLFFRYDRALRAAYLRAQPHRPIDDAVRDGGRERFLTPGALWRAIRRSDRCVVLIDELDKAPLALDHALLEWLEEFKISDPLLGTIEPVSRPYVVLTSNTTRPLSEQLRDRCVFVYFEPYTPEREAEIIRAKSGADPVLAAQVAYLCRAFREIGFKAPPSIREALDMIAACQVLGLERLNQNSIGLLLHLAVKRRDDGRRAEKNLPVLYARAVEIAEEHAIKLSIPICTERGDGTGRGSDPGHRDSQEVLMQTTHPYDEEDVRRREQEREHREQEERERERRRREEWERDREADNRRER